MPPIATFQGQAGRNKRRGSMPWRNAFIGQGRELGSGNVIGTPMMNKNNARFPEPQSVSQHHVPFGLTNESTPQVTERAKHGYDNGIDDDEGGTYTPLLRQSGPDNSDYEDQPKPKRRKVDGDRTVSVYVEDKQVRIHHPHRLHWSIKADLPPSNAASLAKYLQPKKIRPARKKTVTIM